MAGITESTPQLTSPAWCADFITPERLMPGGARLDISQFYAQDSTAVRVAAAALAAATSVSIGATTQVIPNGTTIHLGTNKFFTVNQAGGVPVTGATQSVTVLAIPTALVGGETGRYLGDGTKKHVVRSGTVLGRTIAERLANTGFGPASVDDDEIFFMAFENSDIVRSADCDLLRAPAAIKENFLPEWTTLNTAVDEVQTVVLNGTLSGGQFKVGARLSDGSFKWSEDIAYNANLAAIQAGYDTVYGASKVVIAGTVPSHTVTFSGTGYTGVDQVERIQVDANEVTGITSVTVTRTTGGGKALLARLRKEFRMTTGVN